MVSRFLPVVGVFFSLIFSIAKADAAPAYLHLVAQGETSVADAAPIYSCLAYQGCGVTTYNFGGGNRLHIYTDKKLRTVLEDLAACDFGTTKVRVFGYFDASDTVFTSVALSGNASANLSPAVLSTKVMTDLEAALPHLDFKNQPASVETLIEILGIRTFGYRSTFAAHDEGGAAAVTDHEKKTIQFGENLGESIPRVVRHEFDHVLQVKLDSACRKMNTFNLHKLRERAAYLNDAHYFPDSADWSLSQAAKYNR